MKTLSKHVKYRAEKESIFICNCKELIDLKVDNKYLPFFDRLNKGIEEKDLDNQEKQLLKELSKLKLLSELKFKKLEYKKYEEVWNFLEKYLFLESNMKDRPRSYDFLLDKLKENQDFFIGLFMDNELIGVIQGFPREDYFLMSEIAVSKKFRSRGFGALLVNEFEKRAKQKKFKKIKAGAQNNAVNFYKKLGYIPSILIQINKKDKIKDFEKLIKKYKIMSLKEIDDNIIIEIGYQKLDISFLDELKKEFNAFSTQYIFTKYLK